LKPTIEGIKILLSKNYTAEMMINTVNTELKSGEEPNVDNTPMILPINATMQ
jgi:hypothetical protein